MYVCVKANYYQVFLPFVGPLKTFSAQKCFQNLTFLLKGKVYYFTCFSTLNISSTILRGNLGKINKLTERQLTVAKLKQMSFFGRNFAIFLQSVKTLDPILP